MIASTILKADIFAVYYEDVEKSIKSSFQDAPEHRREIMLQDDQLVGVVSIGKWDDLKEIFQLVYEKTIIDQKNLEVFEKTGSLLQLLKRTEEESNIVCYCMHVVYNQIQKLILEGVTRLDKISEITGAGTVCRGCRFLIKEILGSNIWTYVKIKEIRKHNEKVRTYQLAPLDGEPLSIAQAGQHIVVEAYIQKRWIARSYTLTSFAKDHYEITVKEEKFGLFLRWLFSHDNKNILLRVSSPEGTYFFQPEKNIPTLCFVAGVGVTPAIVFLRKLIAAQQKRRFHVDYSVHSANDIIFKDEISDWQHEFSHISINMRITSLTGHIQEQEIHELLEKYPEADIYLCGPTAYMDSISAVLKKAGIAPNKIHTEKFTQAGEPLVL